MIFDLPTSKLRSISGLFVARGAVAIICVAALATLCGWAFEIPALRSLIPGAVQMKVNTASAFLMSGVALYLLAGKRSVVTDRLGALLACAVGAIGIATLSEYLFGWQLGIDQLLIKDDADAYNPVPGRMSPMSSLAFVAISIALIGMMRSHLKGVTIAAATVILVVGSVSLLGYLWHAGELITDRWLPPVAFNSAVCFELIGVAILFSARAGRPRRGAAAPELRRVEIRVIAGFVMALALLIFAGGYTYTTSVSFADSVAWIAHTQEVRVSLAEISNAMANAELAQRDFLLTADQERRNTFERLSAASEERVKTLESLLVDNPAQQANLAVLRSDVDSRIAAMGDAITAFDHFGVAAARAVVRLERLNNTAGAEIVRAQADRMDRVEEALLDKRQSVSEHKRVITFVSLVCTLALAAMLFIALFRGIREEMRVRENLEDELRNKAKLLEESNKELESFSYSVSHDLRAPLRAINGFALMLEEDYVTNLDAEGRRYLAVIRENTDRMGALVDDLLAFSRLGRQAVSKTEVNVDALVRDVVEEALRFHKGTVPQIHIESLPSANADQGLVRQVWVNLISNALKYGSKVAEPVITVTGQRSAQETTYVIKDNGVGFNMDYAAKLFGVFQRLHRSDEFEGTGVGLAIVQRIISRHGGRIWAEGKVNQGAIFSFALPSGDNHG
jgi:signal transduction histidine kinase